MAAVDNRESVKPLLASLPGARAQDPDHAVLQDMTQSQIATELGISQMHVSRLLAQTLTKLRTALVDA